MQTSQTPQPIAPAAAAKSCDICHEHITPGERFHDDGDEIAHTHCVSGWFSGNFGRETLR